MPRTKESGTAILGMSNAAQRSKEAEGYRIEADCALREVDALEVDLGIAVEALNKIAVGRPNKRFDPWAQRRAREALAQLRPEKRPPTYEAFMAAAEGGALG